MYKKELVRQFSEKALWNATRRSAEIDRNLMELLLGYVNYSDDVIDYWWST